MKEHLVMGIFCNKNRRFYYFDPGPVSHSKSVDRLRTILMGRDLIRLTDEGPSAGYKIISLAQAKLDGVDTEVIHTNQHVKAQREKVQSEDYAEVWG